MDLTIRPAALGDADTIAAYNAAMARETEKLELDPGRVGDGVRAVLADNSKGFYVVGEADGRMIGQMMITFEWSDWRNGVFWWIQSVYVHPDFRGQGVFKALYQYVAERAKNAKTVCGLRLYVERHNRNAQQTYERLGMTQTAYDIYEVDFVIQRERTPSLPLRK